MGRRVCKKSLQLHVPCRFPLTFLKIEGCPVITGEGIHLACIASGGSFSLRAEIVSQQFIKVVGQRRSLFLAFLFIG